MFDERRLNRLEASIQNVEHRLDTLEFDIERGFDRIEDILDEIISIQTDIQWSCSEFLLELIKK